MANRIQGSLKFEVIRIVAVYALFGGLWIYLSDTFLGSVIHDPATISRISMYKGLIFILLTAALLYVLISRYIRRIIVHTNELNQAHQKLEHQKMLLDIVVEGTPDAVYIKDLSGRYLLANSAVASFVNKPIEEIIGRDDRNLFPSDEAQALMAKDQWVMTQAGGPKMYEEQITTIDGERVFLSTKGAVRGPDGAVSGLFGVARDITERKQAEEKTNELNRDFVAFLENTSDFIYFKDVNSRIRFCSQTMARITGYSSWRDLIGKHDLEIFPEDTGRIYYEEEVQVFRDGKALLNKRDPYYDESGNPGWVSTNKWPLQDKDGKVVGLFGISNDITERVHQEEELLHAKEQSESANRAKSEFLANMSHEIRTPMSGVMGMAQLLEMTSLSQEQSEYLGAIKTSGSNLLSLINDILDLSKIEAGKIDIVSNTFSLRTSINDIVLTQKSVVYEKQLSLNIDVDSDVPHVLMGDQLRVKQILLNLLGNAVKFTSQGSITISAQVREQNDTSALVEIAVLDTGIGISAEAQDKIFLPFVQEDGSTTRQFGGTGLGLTISRRLVELMNGSISVHSTPGVGSCFKVILRFSIVQKVVADENVLNNATTCWEGPQLRILFVEDNLINARFGTSLLNRTMGHYVVTAANGIECLDKLEQGTFDLVMMDIQMPVMNGVEALQAIRCKEIGTTLHQPVIALTAYAQRAEEECFLQQGFDGYVSKPYEISELIYEMKRVIGNCR